MYLKSLTLRGFKSFADPTTLEFEPGITVIVGPNGSGKSNVVDAVAWVLGAQGPRVVRSSKMDDVIFAGTAKRAALGRAEVSLTIDNSSRRLPVDLAEVTITRTLFRTGESEYSLNGVACRLLDIQDLLSDAGVGRQQHVIMGQGQLDSVLQARPEDRRAVIEEAAGILKFRRRRERAERRLEATEQNILRLQDLEREVRRQLKPLERQAEAARRHGALAAELRALRLYLAGRNLEALQRRLAEGDARQSRLASDEARLSAELARLDDLVANSEAALSEEQARDVSGAAAAAERLLERAIGLAGLVTERRRAAAAAMAASTDADVLAALEAESTRLGEELGAAEQAGLALAPEWEEIEALEAALDSARRSLAKPPSSAPRGVAAHEPSVAAGDPTALRRQRDELARRLADARESLARQAERRAALERQADQSEHGVQEAEARLFELAAEVALRRAALEDAEERERLAAGAVTAAEAEARELGGRAQALAARQETLEEALEEAHARAGVAHLAGLPGVLGTLLDVVEVDEGCERAFEAAVEEALGSVVVDGRASARQALEHLRSSGLGGAVLALGSDEPSSASAAPGRAGRMAEPLRARVRARHPAVAVLLDRLLDGVTLCSGDFSDALDLAERERVVVTLQGDRFSPHGWRLGAGRAGATRAALESVSEARARAEAEAERARLVFEEARRRHAAARGETKEIGRGFEAGAAEHRAVAAGRDEQARRWSALSSELASLEGPRRSAARLVAELEAGLAAAESAVSAAEDVERAARAAAEELAQAQRSLDEQARALSRRRAELEVRVAGIEERKSLLSSRRDEVERKLAGYEAARRQATERRREHEKAGAALGWIAATLDSVLQDLRELASGLGVSRASHEARLAGIGRLLSGSRQERAGAERELAGVREQLQRNELERAETRVRLETAVESLRQELDCEPTDAIGAPCPELPPGAPAAARLRELERELRLIGPINPLAVEELEALTERARFLSGQLEDVRTSRRELGRVIKAVDAEIVGVFGGAFADVARHFEALFSTLFPGGTGRLTLLDPSDLLSTGVEIEARPAGRNVRRLSLLSGGERSLVALAFLFAVFRSRPSPFYLMDEVEAALDDVNLHRFLDLVDEFRGEAQLLLVSHQKRTMESADILYGVSMQPGGASKVVSERLGRGRGGDGLLRGGPGEGGLLPEGARTAS